MMQILNVLSVVFWGLLVLSLLVFIHEGGHFLAARAFGMRVTEFFLGMPSRFRLAFKSKRYGTEFGVTPILLGGYTRICGMEGEEDELLAPALACVQELGCDEERAYGLVATLADWGSIRPYYDPELGERVGQSTWPEAFETLARDDRLLTEYDRDHDFSREGSTGYAEPRVAQTDIFKIVFARRADVAFPLDVVTERLVNDKSLFQTAQVLLDRRRRDGHLAQARKRMRQLLRIDQRADRRGGDVDQRSQRLVSTMSWM